jgi:hypothetical protein
MVGIEERLQLTKEEKILQIGYYVLAKVRSRLKTKTKILADGYLESNYSHSIWRQSPGSFFCLLKNPSTFASFACPGFDFRISAELYSEALILYSLPDPSRRYVYASELCQLFAVFGSATLAYRTCNRLAFHESQ